MRSSPFDPGSVTDCLREYLNQHGVAFREIHHDPTPTSEDSARARGESLRVGGKALVLKVGAEFKLFVLPADRRFDSGAVKKQMETKKLRFASADELLELTGLVPGSVPPFGHPILPLPLICDEAIRENDRIAFNAGSLTISFVLPMDEYLRVAQPEFMAFSQ